MQISRRFLLACTATAILFPSILGAQDATQETDAQIKARQALERKMKEVESQPPATPAPAEPAPTVTVVPEPKPAKAKKPAAKPAPAPAAPAVTPAPAAPVVASASETAVAAASASAAASAEAIEKARAALHQKTGQTESETVIRVTSAEPASDAKTEAAINQAVAESQKAAADKAAHEAQMPKTAKAQPQVIHERPQAAMLEPMQGPPTGLAASKEQQLHDLLEQYKADALTPDQYHAARAKILSAP